MVHPSNCQEMEAPFQGTDDAPGGSLFSDGPGADQGSGKPAVGVILSCLDSMSISSSNRLVMFPLEGPATPNCSTMIKAASPMTPFWCSDWSLPRDQSFKTLPVEKTRGAASWRPGVLQGSCRFHMILLVEFLFVRL